MQGYIRSKVCVSHFVRKVLRAQPIFWVRVSGFELEHSSLGFKRFRLLGFGYGFEVWSYGRRRWYP